MHEHRAGDPDAGEQLRDRRESRPNRRRRTRPRPASEASRPTGAPPRARGRRPLQAATRTIQRSALETEQRERRVRRRNEHEDHRVVEPSRPHPPRRALPREAVVEGAGAEHRGECRGIHPRGEGRERTVREDDEHRPRGERGEEGPLVEDAHEGAAGGRLHRRHCRMRLAGRTGSGDASRRAYTQPEGR